MRKKILILLARFKMSKVDLAKKAGISRQTLSTILSGNRCKPETIGKIAEALKVDVTEIIDLEEI